MKTVQPIRNREKIEAMKKILRATSLRSELLFVLGINTGLRISDLLALTIGDVVCKKAALNPKMRRLIERYIEGERQGATHEEPLFLSQKGKSISRQHAYYLLNEAARAVGISERIGTHSLRKTFGYFAYKQGVDLSMIQKLLNHSSQAETLRYIGITQEMMDEVVLRLDL